MKNKKKLGRPPGDPKHGSRVGIGTKYRADHAAFIRENGIKVSEAIDMGLSIALPTIWGTRTAPPLPGREECLIAYNAISIAIQRIEVARDFDKNGNESVIPQWSDDQAKIHKMLNRFWHEIRQQPCFWEPNRADVGLDHEE